MSPKSRILLKGVFNPKIFNNPLTSHFCKNLDFTIEHCTF